MDKNTTEKIKTRVYTLYRVSTLGQVEKDDIPMQKQQCREFAEIKGWTILKEFSEKGVSGYKVSAKDRDAIQEIQNDAVQGKFDILLVFMFDRLGRRDDETPFVVEWFVKNGIEVWSAMEGQQRFDSHVDKLMNYIRYWQASGESIKTSMRVKTRLGQLTEEGLYTGGSIPYGYKLEKRGRVNKKNREVMDLVIDEDESKIVQLIFQKYVYEGFGAQRLCHYLHDEGYKGRKGKGFPNTTLNRIIKNILYTGVIKNGESFSPPIEDLRIIDNDTFDRAQEIMKQRTMAHGDTPLNLSGQSLLVGNIFCAHCGNRLTLTTSGYHKKEEDGSKYRKARARYQCHYNVRHPGECDGQSGYSVKIIDDLVEKAIRDVLAEIKTASQTSIVDSAHKKEIALSQLKKEQSRKYVEKAKSELADYQAEIIKVIRGESKIDEDILNELILQAKKALAKAEESFEIAKSELNELEQSAENLNAEYRELLSWADMFDKCSFDSKKMIVSQLIKSVRVGKDYAIEIDFNVTFEEYQRYFLQKSA